MHITVIGTEYFLKDMVMKKKRIRDSRMPSSKYVIYITPLLHTPHCSWGKRGAERLKETTVG